MLSAAREDVEDSAACSSVIYSKKGVRLAQNMQVGPCIIVIIQLAEG
jgi:hypothetical protein